MRKEECKISTTLSILVLIFLILSIFIIDTRNAFAAVNEPASVEYVASCPSSYDGKHHMEGRSTCCAKVMPAGTKYWGTGGQCKYCHLLTVTQNNLFLNPSQVMGWYATRSATGTQGGPFTMEVTSIKYNTSTTQQIWKSFKWE